MFGDELKKARKSLKINGKPFTQERLAELFYELADVSCTRQSVGYWENGANKPTMDNALLLSVILNNAMKKCKLCGKEHNETLTAKVINTEFGDHAYDPCRSAGDLCGACSVSLLAGGFVYNSSGEIALADQ